MKITAQKILALALGIGSAGVATGCAVDNATDEDIASVDGAFTKVDHGVCATTVQIAAEIVRTAMVDLGRYRPGLDLVKGQNGFVTLTQGGKDRCRTRGGCPRLKSLLSYQELTNIETNALAGEFPWMRDLQTGNIANALASSMSDSLNPRPDAVISHNLTFHHISNAKPLANCSANLKYHCFSVSGLPSGKSVNDLVNNLRSLFASNDQLSAMTRVANESGYLCIDPDGTGDDQTGGGSTGGSTCVDGTMAMSYDASFVGNCCSLASGSGYLVQNMTNPAFMSCKIADAASGKSVTVSSASGSNPAGNVTDGSVDTIWKASTNAANQWAKIDLGNTQTLTGVTFRYEQPGAYGFKVETSINNVTWSLKKSGTSVDNAAWQDAIFASSSVRYIRITLTSLPAGRSAALGSLRAF